MHTYIHIHLNSSLINSLVGSIGPLLFISCWLSVNSCACCCCITFASLLTWTQTPHLVGGCSAYTDKIQYNCIEVAVVRWKNLFSAKIFTSYIIIRNSHKIFNKLHIFWYNYCTHIKPLSFDATLIAFDYKCGAPTKPIKYQHLKADATVEKVKKWKNGKMGLAFVTVCSL